MHNFFLVKGLNDIVGIELFCSYSNDCFLVNNIILISEKNFFCVFLFKNLYKLVDELAIIIYELADFIDQGSIKLRIFKNGDI